VVRTLAGPCLDADLVAPRRTGDRFVGLLPDVIGRGAR
jgi:hypothetical protein